MKKQQSNVRLAEGPPAEYQASMAEIEERAARGEMTIAEVKREIFALRERFGVGPEVVMQWAAQAHASNHGDTGTPAPCTEQRTAKSALQKNRKVLARS